MPDDCTTCATGGVLVDSAGIPRQPANVDWDTQTYVRVFNPNHSEITRASCRLSNSCLYSAEQIRKKKALFCQLYFCEYISENRGTGTRSPHVRIHNTADRLQLAPRSVVPPTASAVAQQATTEGVLRRSTKNA